MAVIVKDEDAFKYAAKHTQWQTTLPSPWRPHVHRNHGCREELGEKSRPFKTISFILYVFWYLAYTTRLAIILNTIDTQ